MKILTLILTISTLTSCCNTKDVYAMQDNKKSINTITEKYVVSNIGTENVSEHHLTLQFNDSTNTVSGFSGCNRFSGSYKITGNSISFGPLASTRMACMDETNKIETNMLEALSKANTFTIENQNIKLLNGDDVLLDAKQDNSYIIEYTALSRGLFNQYIFENNKLTIQKDRASSPTSIDCTQEESDAVIEILKSLNLEELKTYEAPTEKRLYDGAAIATLKITHQGKTYQTPEFDHGDPNKEIAPLVNAILKLSEKKQKID